MRSVAWTVLLCFRPGWSFQMVPSSLRGPTRRVTAVDGSSSSSSKSSNRCTLQSTGTLSETNSDTEVAGPRSPGLKGIVSGFLAAAFVLASEPAATLADAGSLPAAASSSSVAATLQSAVDESPVAVVATTKLEGELAAQFQKAQAAGSVQQFDKAKKLYNQVIKYAPGYVYGWSNRGNVLIADGDLKGAVADYNKALELADGLNMPDKWVIFLNRGTTLLALGEDDLALSDLNQAAKLNNQKDLYTLANRAQAFERRGDWSKALVDYEGAINVQPGNVQPWWIRYSLVLFQEGRDFDSLACLRRLQSKFEGVAEVQAALTSVQFGRGEMKEAEKAWRGINVVDQQTYLKESYLKDQLKWPPRMVECLEGFDRAQKQESTGAA